MSWGSAAVALPGTTIPGPADINDEGVVVVPEPDLSLPITDLPAKLGSEAARSRP